MFHTLQDRLVCELALAGIATVDQANAFIRDAYVPSHNLHFAVKAEHDGSAFVAIPGYDLKEVLCVQEGREVGNDNTVAFNRMRLQNPPSPLRAHFVRARVKVHQYPDGMLAIFRGRLCLGRYNRAGALKDHTPAVPV